jgi:hypothetical protein
VCNRYAQLASEALMIRKVAPTRARLFAFTSTHI